MRYEVRFVWGVTLTTLYTGGSAKKALEVFNLARTLLHATYGYGTILVMDHKTLALSVEYADGIPSVVTGPAVFTGLGKK